MNTKGKLSIPSLLVIGIVAIVAIVTIISGQTNIEGAPVYKEHVNAYQKVCSDDDPTNDHYIDGVVRAGAYIYKDYCRDDKVYQYYCKNNGAQLTKSFECPNGCIAGKCRG